MRINNYSLKNILALYLSVLEKHDDLLIQPMGTTETSQD